MKDLIEALNRAHQLDEAHKALDRDDVYQYLFKLLQDDDMNDFIFTTCENIAKKYKIDVSPYWPLDKILDRFTDEELAEVLQTVEEHSSIPANDQRDESWTDYAARRLDEDPEDFLEEMFAKFVEEAYTLVEAEGYTDVFTEPSTQAGKGGDFFWAEKDGVSYQGNYDFETEQEEIGDCCLNADSEEEAIELCAKKYASIILSSLKPDLEEDLNTAHELDETTSSLLKMGLQESMTYNPDDYIGRKVTVHANSFGLGDYEVEQLKPYIGNTYTITDVERDFGDADESFDTTYWYLSGIEDAGPFGGYTLELKTGLEESLDESMITDFISSDTLHRVMHHPGFGSFHSYQQLDNMMVKLSVLTNSWQEKNHYSGRPEIRSIGDPQYKYFKFVRSEGGWEAYEVTETGEQLGEPFALNI